MCPDSKMIQKYSYKRTKQQQQFRHLSSQQEIVTNVSGKAFSIAIDGSHCADEETLYPIVAAYRSDLGENCLKL
ncbi:hypothetical protein PR048_007500 [Dryococelus australis]|uniref:Uncharacterized protein n=1 Tax=Dryococelus australis TaxID=614101 RepID=A0ABQ9HUE1_9NEOP|nr:hypothetical protein PR048_007500 [Dryococelus australis]